MARALADAPRAVLAVSGGLDSMVLLDAAVHAARGQIAAVAVFDHGTGPAARRAAAHVARRARALGLPVRTARAAALAPREAAWREARWGFLRGVAADLDAVVATGHTLDDHLETIVMRVLRDAGSRGLAALHAGDGVVRPLLGFRRAELARYASVCGVTFIDDPSNASRRHLRNRVRHDLLPAFERMAAADTGRPGAFGAALCDVARRAWALRQEVDAFLARRVRYEVTGRTLGVARADVAGYDLAGLRLLWPALAARAGVTLDRRGTERIAAFTITGRHGARVQLSGGVEVVRVGERLLLRPQETASAFGELHALRDALALGGWRFRAQAQSGAPADLWSALLPRGAQVRGWRPGDRMVPHGSTTERRLKGLFRDAGVDAVRRRVWPIVLVDGHIVWVPGVRRSSAATARSGRPLVLYHCERDDH